MSLLIDIHCHLDHPRFTDLDKVMENAKKVGVKVILTDGINPETNRKTLEIAKRYDIVKAALGIYPINQLKKEINIDEELDFIKKNKNSIIAIGEVGLDGLDKGNLKEQKTLFEKLIKLAENINKPIIVHSRKAEQEVIEILGSSKLKKVLLHCFSGKKNLVKRAAELGYYFSIPTKVVRAENFQLMIKEVNINQLFCETDAPYLSPYNNKTNEPAFIVESYKKIAEIKGMMLEEVEKNIWMNYQKLIT